MNAPAADIFDQIANTKVTTRGNYFNEGSGIVVLTECSYKSLDGGPTFIAEHQIVQSKPNGQLGIDGKPTIPNAPGTTATFIQQPAKFPKTAGANIKAYVCALVGIDPDSVIGAEPHEQFKAYVNKGEVANFANATRAICGPDQVAKGALLAYETYRQSTKAQKAAGRGEYNTYVRFTHIKGQSEDQIFARREALERGESIAL